MRKSITHKMVNTAHADYHDLSLSPPNGGEIVFSGDHIWKVTPVPIPNTAVKLPEPMVVPKARE